MSAGVIHLKQLLLTPLNLAQLQKSCKLSLNLLKFLISLSNYVNNSQAIEG